MSHSLALDPVPVSLDALGKRPCWISQVPRIEIRREMYGVFCEPPILLTGIGAEKMLSD